MLSIVHLQFIEYSLLVSLEWFLLGSRCTSKRIVKGVDCVECFFCLRQRGWTRNVLRKQQWIMAATIFATQENDSFRYASPSSE